MELKGNVDLCVRLEIMKEEFCATKCIFHDIVVNSLDHTSEEFVDFLFSVTKVTTFNVVVCLLAPSTGGCVELVIEKQIVIFTDIRLLQKRFQVDGIRSPR